jgi:hypothetical protein
VGYEVFLVPVTAGADVEDAAEALIVRLARGHERTRMTEAGRAEAQRLSSRLSIVDPDLVAAREGAEALPGSMELRATSGVTIVITDRFARFVVPFALLGEAAARAFREMFDLLAAAAQATGWSTYDPQVGASAPIDEASCDSALEIYLSVMDQLRPSGARST